MQRIGTQINMHNNLVSAMQNTMQGQATAVQAESQGTQALLEGLGGAAATGVKGGIFDSSPSTVGAITPQKIINTGAVNRSGSILGPIWSGTNDPYLGISGSYP